MCHVGTLTTVKYKSASINTIFLQEKVINRSPWYELLVISDNVENRSTLATIQSPSSVILVLLHTHTIFLLYFLPTYLPGSIPQSSPPDTGKYLLLDHSAHYQNIDTAERTWHHMSPSDRLKNQEKDFGLLNTNRGLYVQLRAKYHWKKRPNGNMKSTFFALVPSPPFRTNTPAADRMATHNWVTVTTTSTLVTKCSLLADWKAKEGMWRQA